MMRQRQRRQTLLIYCEGPHDSLFVQHLKKLYAPSNKKN